MGARGVRRLRTLLVVLAGLSIATSAIATERFRLGARLGEGELLTEWIELEEASAHNQMTMMGGIPFWDTKVEFEEPLVARHILGRLYSPWAPEAAPAVFEGTRVNGEIRFVRPDSEATTEAWKKDGIFLPRSLLGYELVLREARSRKLESLEFTWFDPQFRTETGRLTFVDEHRVRFRFDQDQGGIDEFVVDDAVHITGGELGIGGTVYRGEWLPETKRPRMPASR